LKAAEDLAPDVGVTDACEALGVSRATFYRRRAPLTGQQQPRPTRDCSPAEVVATLLDDGTYLCSERTMYRILASKAAVRERRAQRRHPTYKKTELVATAPNQVWSWDITRLLGPRKWTY